MAASPSTFYRYRAFSTATLECLCNDTIYFAHPGTFNDPLDCSPTLEVDSPIQDLRELLKFLIKRRVAAEVASDLRKARVKGASASEHANAWGNKEAVRELKELAYQATDTDHEMGTLEAESWLIQQQIERELLRYYERGVCCFSTRYSSPLLWSHYGDQHNGLCIGYGLDRNPSPQLEKVIYGGSRSIRSSILVDSFLKNSDTAHAQLNRDVLLRKAKGWRYECEWRLIGEQGIQDSPLLLKDVTFGLRCADSVKHAVVKALQGRLNEVRFFEMYEVRGSYALRRRALDLDWLGAFLPRTAASFNELFGSS